MKIRTVPRHKPLLLCTVLCAAMLAFGHNASALSVGDSHELGFLWPGLPVTNQNNTTYVNHMIGMALGATDIANGQIYFRSNNTFGSLPSAVWALNGSGTTINLGAGGIYTYLFASYSGLGAEVWYIGDLHGVITIPGIFNLCGLTKWTLFGPAGVGVPDGGATAMLLGAALGALGMARRFLKR
jgi:VPDSG-CTERM motif